MKLVCVKHAAELKPVYDRTGKLIRYIGDPQLLVFQTESKQELELLTEGTVFKVTRANGSEIELTELTNARMP